ncbi:MAG: Sec-independent protein translocase protein TatB [Syntrophomonadaceae bacterium]
MFNIGPWELILILVIALIVVGPGKLPEVAKSLGKATREFKKATSGMKKEIDEMVNSTAVDPTPAARIQPAENQENKQAPPQPEGESSKE